MSKAAKARKQSVPNAIKTCRAAIEDGTADWSTYYRLGALLSSCGAWEWGYDRYSPLAVQRLLEALDLLERAANEIPCNSPKVCVNFALIVAEKALVVARLSRLSGYDHAIKLVQPTFNFAANLMWPLADSGDSDAAHALCVLYAYSMLPFFGSDLGFRGTPDYLELFRRAAIADQRFGWESGESPDHEAAYRWLMLQLAVAHGKNNDPVRSKHSAKRALRSAIRFSDWEHVTRAAIILVFGLKGESVHRWWRYRKVRNV